MFSFLLYFECAAPHAVASTRKAKKKKLCATDKLPDGHLKLKSSDLNSKVDFYFKFYKLIFFGDSPNVCQYYMHTFHLKGTAFLM